MATFTPLLQTLPYGEDETPIGGLLLEGKPLVRLPDLPYLLGYLSGGSAYDMARYAMREEQLVRTHFYHEDGTRNRVTTFVSRETAHEVLRMLAKRRGSHAEGYDAAVQWLDETFFPWLRSTADPARYATLNETRLQLVDRLEQDLLYLNDRLQATLATVAALKAQL
jgi:hypothetical protein